jgi:hypothetical protein
MAGMKNVSFILGLNNGWDNDIDGGSGKTIEAQVGLTPSDTMSLLLTGYYGDEASTTVDQDKRGLIDLVATFKPTDDLIFLLNYDRGSQATPTSGTDLWQGYALYLSMALNEKLKLSARGEYFDDNDGARTGIPSTGKEVTLTLANKMKENLEWRVELRHDMANTDVFEDDDGTFTDSQDTIAVAAYYSF